MNETLTPHGEATPQGQASPINWPTVQFIGGVLMGFGFVHTFMTHTPSDALGAGSAMTLVSAVVFLRRLASRIIGLKVGAK